MFIDNEKLFTDWAEPRRWRQAMDASLQEWMVRQSCATVRRFPEATADQLRSMGYVVTPPAS